jgi:glucokinase
MDKRVYIGVDLGGTKTTAGLVTGDTVVSLKTIPTRGDRPAGEIVGDICRLIGEVSDGNAPGGIGVGVPNPAGPGSDRLIQVENIPPLENFPLKTHLRKLFGVPVALENDANCMAVGEHRAGALAGCSHAVCLTLGTGLGCGIIIDGALYRGMGFCAGEIWNIPIGGSVLEETVNLRRLTSLAREMPGERSPERLCELALAGNADAASLFDQYGEAVGQVAVMVLSFLDPERIALGGGISRAFEAFRNGMGRVVADIWGQAAVERIVPAQLSDTAAVLGAALLAREAVDE